MFGFLDCIIVVHLGKLNLGFFEILNNYGTCWKNNSLGSPWPSQAQLMILENQVLDSDRNIDAILSNVHSRVSEDIDSIFKILKKVKTTLCDELASFSAVLIF